jgi:tRNA1Val (adenine37-N6)-methyltransferase
MPVNSELGEITSGHLLDGRISYAQPRIGFRTGIEPVLLAAAIPARAGQRVIEAGTGAGAALLCLAARVPGVSGVGVELDGEMATLARANAAGNGFSGLEILTGDILAYSTPGTFDHAFANPPYHPAGGTPSPLTSRKTAKVAPAGLFAAWIGSLSDALRTGGTVTLIVPSAALTACLIGMQDVGCSPAVVLPLWPKPNRDAKLLMLRGLKNRKIALKLLPGLVLHSANGDFTPEAEKLLRDGAALEL